jgi:hypothetical protein
MRRYEQIIIDGVTYVPEVVGSVSQTERRLLNELYCILWAEAYYHALNDVTKKFAKPLADRIIELNETMGFKT